MKIDPVACVCIYRVSNARRAYLCRSLASLNAAQIVSSVRVYQLCNFHVTLFRRRFYKLISAFVHKLRIRAHVLLINYHPISTKAPLFDLQITPLFWLCKMYTKFCFFFHSIFLQLVVFVWTTLRSHICMGWTKLRRKKSPGTGNWIVKCLQLLLLSDVWNKTKEAALVMLKKSILSWAYLFYTRNVSGCLSCGNDVSSAGGTRSSVADGNISTRLLFFDYVATPKGLQPVLRLILTLIKLTSSWSKTFLSCFNVQFT